MFINTFTPHGELGGSMPPKVTMVQSFKNKTKACGGMKRGNRFTRAETLTVLPIGDVGGGGQPVPY